MLGIPPHDEMFDIQTIARDCPEQCFAIVAVTGRGECGWTRTQIWSCVVWPSIQDNPSQLGFSEHGFRRIPSSSSL